MKVLIIGGGGREHALAWKMSQSTRVTKLYCAPGNAGIASVAECIPIKDDRIEELCDFAVKQRIDLTVVGPELPLTLGIVDTFEAAGLRIFGPCKEAAQLEGSKAYAKQIMKEAGIPTAGFTICSDPGEAKSFIQRKNAPVVVKADGLAAGKGVFPCRDAQAAFKAVDTIMVDRDFGSAGSRVVVEDFLEGEEASFICFSDGESIMPLPSSQDHKAAFDNDTGPNTGGMGAYSPAPVVTPEIHSAAMNDIMEPLLAAFRSRGVIFKGIIYAGLMIQDNTPYVLEFNVRFGDPETQPILFRIKSDLIDIFEAAIEGDLSRCSLECHEDPAVCVVMASGGYPGPYSKGYVISGLDEAGRMPDTVVFHAGTVLEGGVLKTAGGRVLGVTARGKSIRSAIGTAYAAVEKIRWDGVHYRTDIGKHVLSR